MLDIKINNKTPNISDLFLTPLKEINVEGGNVLHALFMIIEIIHLVFKSLTR